MRLCSCVMSSKSIWFLSYRTLLRPSPDPSGVLVRIFALGMLFLLVVAMVVVAVPKVAGVLSANGAEFQPMETMFGDVAESFSLASISLTKAIA